MFDNVAASIAFIRDGKLRPLAISSRTDALPDVALISDFVPGYEVYVWNGIGAPKNTPVDIVDKLNTAINAIVVEPAFKTQLTDLGNTAVSDSPSGFGKLIAADAEKWEKVVKFAAIKPE
jgi:tripartite-type tricarboxylate transporter receptor subunit TctC